MTVREDAIAQAIKKVWTRRSTVSASHFTTVMLAEMNVPCEWTVDDDGYWKTACGEEWSFEEGSPKDNGVNFCFSCGQPVRVMK